jgi:hypothetical protein
MDGRTVSLRYKLPNTAKQMRFGARRPLHRLLRTNLGSYWEVHVRTYLIFQETNNQMSRVCERYTATDGVLRLHMLTWYMSSYMNKETFLGYRFSNGNMLIGVSVCLIHVLICTDLITYEAAGPVSWTLAVSCPWRSFRRHILQVQASASFEMGATLAPMNRRVFRPLLCSITFA